MLQKLSKNAGAKIVVHESALPPLTDEYGIDLAPNTASSIAIQTVRDWLCAAIPFSYRRDKTLIEMFLSIFRSNY